MEPPRQPQGGSARGRLGRAVTIFREFLGKAGALQNLLGGQRHVVVLLAGGFSVAEQTLFAAGRGAAVQESRMALQETLAERMEGTVEELTGRKVVAFLSASHQEPDLSAELFLLEPLEPDSPLISSSD